VNVVDFASLIEFDEISPSKLKAPELTRSMRLVRTRDSLTASSTADEEDEVLSFSSSLSSHSEDENDQDLGGFEIQTSRSGREEDRRSIFSHYWKTTGQEPLELIRENSHSIIRSPANARLSLLDKEDPPAPVTPRHKSRRSIFGMERSEVHASMRSLPEMSAVSSAERMESARKTRSASCLQSKRLPSCLRKSDRSTASSSSSVTFDAQVQVITFERPIENWSDGSWTKVFGVY
jgi:hypothetical protein